MVHSVSFDIARFWGSDAFAVIVVILAVTTVVAAAAALYCCQQPERLDISTLILRFSYNSTAFLADWNQYTLTHTHTLLLWPYSRRPENENLGYPRFSTLSDLFNKWANGCQFNRLRITDLPRQWCRVLHQLRLKVTALDRNLITVLLLDGTTEYPIAIELMLNPFEESTSYDQQTISIDGAS